MEPNRTSTLAARRAALLALGPLTFALEPLTFTLGPLILVSMALLSVASPAAGQDVQVTLSEAIERALRVQPTMIQAEGDARVAAAADRSAWGAFLPSLSTGASATRGNVGRVDNTTGRVVPPQTSYTFSLGANLDLFEGFRRLAQRQAASAGVDAAEAGLRGSRFEVALATQQVFYDAAAWEELVRVGEDQLRRAEQQLQAAVDRLQAGTATRSDSLRGVVEVGNARIQLLQAESNLASARMNLGRQIGLIEPVRALPDTVLPPLPSLETVQGEVIDQAPDVAQSEAQARVASARKWAAQAEYWPTLNMSYNTNRQGPGSPFDNFDDYNETSTWRFGLAWTLFNGFQREGNQVSARVDKEVAQAQAADTRRRVNAEVLQQYTASNTAFVQIEIAATNAAAAAEDLRVQNERYRLGAATILDLLTSQSALTEAQVSLIQARFNYLIARAELEALIGVEL